MSKGSNRRPERKSGAYRENFDKIDWSFDRNDWSWYTNDICTRDGKHCACFDTKHTCCYCGRRKEDES